MSLYPDLKEISVRIDGDDVAVVMLDRPAQRNAFTGTMKNSLVEAYRRLDLDDSVRVVVLMGNPDAGKVFCAGADLSQGNFSYEGASASHHRDGGGQTSLAAFRIRKPTIACLNGSAVGIGITMTLSFDMRLAWKDAKIGFVFAQRGIVPEAASSFFLPKLIGHSRALELCMTAKVIPASSPKLDLLWSSLHDTPDETVKASLALAHDIAKANSAISSLLIKTLIWRSKPSPEEQHLIDSKAMFVSGNSVDSQEGVKAFKEKREPKFQATIPRNIPREIYPWHDEVRITRREDGIEGSGESVIGGDTKL